MPLLKLNVFCCINMSFGMLLMLTYVFFKLIHNIAISSYEFSLSLFITIVFLLVLINTFFVMTGD